MTAGPADVGDLYVTLERLAELTGLSVETFRTAMRANELPVKRPTSRPMVRLSDYQAWVESNG